MLSVWIRQTGVLLISLDTNQLHIYTALVTCSLKVRCASKIMPKSFADCDGLICFQSRVMAKLSGTFASLWDAPRYLATEVLFY